MQFKKYAATAIGLALTATSPAFAEGVELNNILGEYELRSDDPDFWKHQNYRAQSIVRSGEYLGARAQAFGHKAMELESADPNTRALYITLSSLANFQFQTANSIYFGHEYAHFQMWDYFGLRTHYFYNFDDGFEIDGRKAYLNILFKGHPDATATNTGVIDPSRDASKRIMTTAAGNNWQMNYSEEWVRRNIQADGMSAFTAMAYLTNRMKTFTYTLNDQHGDDGAIAGDMNKIEDHYVNTLGHEDGTLNKIALYSGLSLLASPATWHAFGSIGNYIDNSETEFRSPFYNIGGAEVTWDIPAYLNADGMSLVPTAYFRVSPGVTVGLGVETAVIGELDDEYTLSLMTKHKGFELSGEYSLSSEDGSHMELDASYRVNDFVSIGVSHVQSDGDSLRGFRNNPYGEDLTIAGVKIRF